MVADAGMISAANQAGIQGAGESFILATRIPDATYVLAQWRREHPDEKIPDWHVFTQPWPASTIDKARGRRDKTIYYQYYATEPGTPCAASMNTSARPTTPWPGRPRSHATGSSHSMGPPKA